MLALMIGRRLIACGGSHVSMLMVIMMMGGAGFMMLRTCIGIVVSR
jgi:hypothetical protein